jgi:hypothetical protein
MRTRRFLLGLLACLVIAAPILAQEGHPLKGSWLGDWGPTKAQRTQVFMVLDWDGKNLTGTINPGPDAVPIQKATLELQQPAPPPGAPAQAAPGRGGGGGGGQGRGGGQGGVQGAAPQGDGAPRGGQGGGRGGQAGPPPPLANWLVHIEADGKDQAGKPAHITIDGKVENLGLYNRSLVGTWTQGTVKGDFRLTRQ